MERFPREVLQLTAEALSMIEEITRSLLRESGITQGMRVLDIGCGNGEMALLLAQMVGRRGLVVGVDRDTAVLQKARAAAIKRGLGQVRFQAGDFHSFHGQGPQFDAIVGRRVLMYQKDPAAELRALAGCLYSGGIVAFQEYDSPAMESPPACMPLHSQVRNWISDTLRREGADVHMGLGLTSVLSAGGFQVDGTRAEALIVDAGTAQPATETLEAMLPRMVEHKVTTPAEVDLPTLAQRLREERTRSYGTMVWELAFAVWGRKR